MHDNIIAKLVHNLLSHLPDKPLKLALKFFPDNNILLKVGVIYNQNKIDKQLYEMQFITIKILLCSTIS